MMKHINRFITFFFVGLLSLTLQTALAQVSLSVSAPAAIAGDYPGLGSTFGPAIEAPVSGPLVAADPANGCTASTVSLTGAIALIDRGTCGFTAKVYNAQQSGAIAVVVCNNNPDFPHKANAMGFAADDPLAPQITIPSMMVSYATCQTLRADLAGAMAAIDPTPIPPAAGEVCATAIDIAPGTHSVAPITAGFGSVFVSGLLDNNSNAKWYRYVPTSNVLATVSSCGQPVDSRLAIITGPDCATLTLLGVHDDCDPSADFASELSFVAQAGQAYYIYWDDRWDFSGFDFTLSEGALPQATVNFAVDMSLQTVGSAGVSVAYAAPGADIPAEVQVVPLTDADGDGIWTGSAALTVLDTIGYFFINGALDPGNFETVPGDCGLATTLGVNVRPLIVGGDTDLPAVCFSGCGQCVFSVTDCDDPFEITVDGAETYADNSNVLGQAAHWSAWPGATQSAVVTTEQAAAGLQSFKIVGNPNAQDVLLLLGDRTEGHYWLSWDQYIDSSRLAYFNIQHQLPTASAGFWAADVFFDGDETGRLALYDDESSEIAFTYPAAEWFRVQFFFDLDNDEARMLINDRPVAAWKFSDGVTNASAPFDLNQLSAINFYPINTNHVWYFDNVSFVQIPEAGEGQYCYTAQSISEGTHTVPELGCYGAALDLAGDYSTGYSGYWFTYTPAEDGWISLSSCGGGADTRGWILSGECHDLRIVGVNDDQCDLGDGDEYASYREAIVTAGTTYYILWDDIWDRTGFQFTIELNTTEPEVGDFCQTALPIQPGEYDINEFTGDAAVTGPTIGATSQGRTPTPYANTEWYSFTPATDGLMTITSCEGAASDTRVWVYTGDCTTFDGLTLVGANDDGCGGDVMSFLPNVPVTAGVTYLIEWDNGWSSDAFIWELIFDPLTVDVTFQVDMSIAGADPGGVFLAGSFSDFQNVAMSDPNADGIYTVTVPIVQNTEVTYKFKNGPDGWESINTSIGNNCTTGEFGDRFYSAGEADATLPVVCFAYCVTCNLVGVDDQALAAGMKVFPNPASDALQVQISAPEVLDHAQLRLFNSLGAEVLRLDLGQVQSQTVTIPVATLPAGAYRLQLASGQAQATQTVIIE